MESIKTIYVKYGETEGLLGAIKDIMKTYDMRLIEHRDNHYKFDRDRSYTRSFHISPAVNGWIAVGDEDEAQSESLSQEISEILKCSVIYIGVKKDLLYYTAYSSGNQVDQYLSNFDYYEYAIDEGVIEKYKGNAASLSSVFDDEEGFQNLLNRCKNGEAGAVETYILILEALGIRLRKEEGVEEHQDEEEEIEGVEEGTEVFINLDDIFYVDFESINIRTENSKEVINAVKQIGEEMGYREVSDFSEEDNKRQGFLKKLLNSVSERRRLKFYISPAVKGWVTLVSEVQTLLGDEADWSFLHIEDRLSKILEKDVVNIFADSEKWGFSVYRNGEENCVYDSRSKDENTYGLPIRDEYKDELEKIMKSPAGSAADIDEVFSRFCSIISIDNYRINIPMDYSEEEFSNHILSRLPDGGAFTSLKFLQKK